MDATIIALSIGVFISLVLGVVNFLWGPAWLSRREKVVIQEVSMSADVAKGGWLFVTTDFRLVRTRGEHDTYFDSAYLKLNRALCRELDQYFEMPPEGQTARWTEPFLRIGEPWDGKLKKGEPVDLSISANFGKRNSLKNAETPKDIRDKVKKLQAKYEICWKSGEGKEYHYRLPKKWWSKFLPEKLWWRI